MDYSTALCDRHGQVIAQGLTLAVQLGAFPDIMRIIVAEHAADSRPGDVFIANDPYGSGGQHLPDIYVVMPIFYGDEIEGYAATMAHHCDVGGIAPGSVAIHATEVFQEGLRLPILKLSEGGRENVTLLRIIEKNTRNPIHVMGDLRAQLSACGAGKRGLSQLLEKYGAEELRAYMNALHDHAESLMRREIAKLDDGVYRYTDWLDGFGNTPEPLPISVEVRITGENIHLDFSGSAPQVPAAINCPIAMGHSASYCAVRCLAHQEIPNCEGYMRPITVSAPEGTIVNPVLPAACGARGVIGYRVFDAIMAALAPVAPTQVIAASEGGPTLFSIGGYHDGRPFVLTEVMVGSWGARAEKDGIEGISNPAANLSNQPVELLEAEFPLEVTCYGLVRDSEGAGRRRGGLAFVREFRICAKEAQLTLRSDRRDHPPYGLYGGNPGAPSMNLLYSKNGERRLPVMPMEALQLKRGDIFRHIAAGGGGFGPAIERDPEAVLNDVLDDKVSIEGAWERYGVAIDPQRMVVDADETRRRRQTMAGELTAVGQ
jgi:N-methylhydantoinase B